MNTLTSIYQDIAKRTAGTSTSAWWGPPERGKSTFIKRFMETMVLPNITDEYRRSGPGRTAPERLRRTVMTAEPKFVPEEAVEIAMEGAGLFRPAHRLRGLPGPRGGGPAGGRPARMVHTPWFPEEIPMAEAAEIGTRKGHCRALHHWHRGHHRRHRHRPAPGGLPGGGGPGDPRAQGAGQALPHPPPTPPGRTPMGPRPSWRRSTTLPGGELPDLSQRAVTEIIQSVPF